MASIVDVASAAAARKQLTDRNSMSLPQSPGSSQPAHNQNVIATPSPDKQPRFDFAAITEQDDVPPEYAVFEVHGKTVKVRAIHRGMSLPLIPHLYPALVYNYTA